MKLHADLPTTLNTITAYGDDYVEINRQRYDHSVVLMPSGNIIPWPIEKFELLEEKHLAIIVEFNPELVILGSGLQHRFVQPALLKSLIRSGIGVEIMDTQAACRTYNILMAEGRNVLAALLLEIPHS